MLLKKIKIIKITDIYKFEYMRTKRKTYPGVLCSGCWNHGCSKTLSTIARCSRANRGFSICETTIVYYPLLCF